MRINGGHQRLAMGTGPSIPMSKKGQFFSGDSEEELESARLMSLWDRTGSWQNW